MDLLKHKGYEGTAEIDMSQKICFGKILFINDLVTYEAETPAGLQSAFEEAVDDYLETCRELNKEAQKSLRGAFNVRVPAEMHRQAIRKALALNSNLNEVVIRALDQFLNGPTTIQNVVNTYVVQDQSKVETIKLQTSPGASRWCGKPHQVGGN